MGKISKEQKYDLNVIIPAFFIPEILPGEEFMMITDQAAPGILPYYAISNYGRIWHVYENHFMRSSWDGPGYRIAVLRHYDGTAKTYRVHRLLMMTFRYFEGCEEKVVNHINGIKTRNYINFPGIPQPDNLEWCDQSYNEKEAFRLGLKKCKRGSEHFNAKLSEDIAINICNMLSQGNFTHKQIAEINQVQVYDVENIKYHRTWNHISKDYNF